MAKKISVCHIYLSFWRGTNIYQWILPHTWSVLQKAFSCVMALYLFTVYKQKCDNGSCPGLCLNIKSPCQYRAPPYGDKIILRTSYLRNVFPRLVRRYFCVESGFWNWRADISNNNSAEFFMRLGGERMAWYHDCYSPILVFSMTEKNTCVI